MTQRFNAYIHSIVAHQIMVSPTNDPGEQYKCALDDFESIMPLGGADARFAFHVKRDRIGVDHYRQWLGLARIEQDRMHGLEMAMLELVNMVRPTPRPVEPDLFGQGGEV